MTSNGAKAEDTTSNNPDAGPNRMVRFFGSDGRSKAQRDPKRAVGYPKSSFGSNSFRTGQEGTVLKHPSIGDLDTVAISAFNTEAYKRHDETGQEQLCWHCDQATKDLDNDTFVLSMNEDDPAMRSNIERYQKQRTLLDLDQIRNHSTFCHLCRLVDIASRNFAELRDTPRGVSVGLCLTSDTIWIDNPDQTSENTISSSRMLSLKLLLLFECPSGLLDAAREPGIGSSPRYVRSSLLRVDNDPMTMSSRFGRKVDPEVINIGLLQKWLNVCGRQHVPFCVKEAPISMAGEVPSELTVIDVVEMKLKKISWEEKYFTLSYVWGKDNVNFRARKGNWELLHTAGGISQVLHQIPWTVRDAINLVSAVGERHLWVDAICIVQDDHVSKQAAIESMALIYSKAFVTIIAASGPDANAGLPGIRRGTRTLVSAIKIKPDLTLMLDQTGLEQDRTDETYWTRAWTYQEQKLSTRTLTFANNRVYWNCRAMNAQEDIANNEDALIAEREGPIQWRGSYYDLDERPDNFSQYTSLVQTYSQMKLGHSIDALHAFRGISDILTSRAKGTTYGGLPVEWLDLALLWEPVASATRRPEHPSWSWAGWEGPIDHIWRKGYLPHIEDPWFRKVWMRGGRWIKWFGEDTEGRFFELLTATEEQYPNIEIDGTVADGGELAEGATPDMVMGTIHVNFRRNSTPKERKILSSYDEYRNLLENSLGLAYSAHNLVFGPPEGRRDHGGKTSDATATVPGTILLRFSSIVAHFRLQPFDGERWGWSYEMNPDQFSYNALNASNPEEYCPGLSKFNILDAQEQWCGTIILNHSWWTPAKAGEIFSFVVLSDAVSWTRAEYPEFLKMNRPPIRDELTSRMEDLHEKAESPYHVMLLEWHGTRADRLGVGKLFKKALDSSCAPGATWQEVVLQ